MTNNGDDENDQLDEDLFSEEEGDLSQGAFEGSFEGGYSSRTEFKYPSKVIVFPLAKRPFFPGLIHTVTIDEKGPHFNILTKAFTSEEKCVGLFLAKPDEIDTGNFSVNDLYDKGFLGRILNVRAIEGGVVMLLLVTDRISANYKKVEKKDGLFIVPIQPHLPPKGPDLSPMKKQREKLKKKARIQQIIGDVRKLVEQYRPLLADEFREFLKITNFYSEKEMSKVADFAASYTTASKEKLQAIIECVDEEKRAQMVHKILLEEMDLNEIQTGINRKIEKTITSAQREFFLKEQLKAIKKELGLEKEGKSVDADKFLERLKEKKLPEEVMKVFNEEHERFLTIDPQSGEYNVSRNYLDWLTCLPWDKQSVEQHQIAKAREILEEDHFGLEDIKKRILEFIAVGKLSGGVKGSIICLVGPPGVGKTSIGKSIARALGRKFYRFSVGGMRDEAEIRGHRRTYIGAMPGKMVQALKSTEVNNPVVMLDEIDKLGSSYHGDPASALLEVLDPEQNKAFLDHYLDVRVDLSNILFITTANVLDTIPDPLKDRMDIMRIAGYLTDEKVEIAQKYLVVRNMSEMGLKASDVEFSRPAIRELVDGYARESGVRNLEMAIKKILRQVAMKKVENEEKKAKSKTAKVKINEKALAQFLGKPMFTSDRYYKRPPVGVATGLAWTSMGGAVLYIEATKCKAKERSLMVTGQLGDVMKESAQIAYSYVNTIYEKYVPKGQKFFETSEGPEKVHIHVPEGATPKDGPSAGITMAVALLSLLTGKKMSKDVGMTGELTLTGKVLPIGGLREKVLAAKRSGLTKIICSAANMRDWEELSAPLKEGMSVVYVEQCEEVFAHVFK